MVKSGHIRKVGKRAVKKTKQKNIRLRVVVECIYIYMRLDIIQLGGT